MLHKGNSIHTLNFRGIKNIIFFFLFYSASEGISQESYAQVKKKKPTEFLEACSILIFEHSKLGFPKKKILKSAQRVPLKSAQIGFKKSSKGCSKSFTGNPILIL